MAAGLRLLRPRETYEIWRKHRLSGYVTMATALAVLLLGIMTGILISVGLAIIIILRQLSRPHEDIRRPPEVPGLMIYRFGAPLLFFNVPYFAARVQAAIDSADPPVKNFLVNAEAMIEIDWQSIDALRKLHSSLKRQGINLGFFEVKGHSRKILKDSRLNTREGFDVYRSVGEAVRQLKGEKEEKKEDKELAG